ncbi:MAG: 3-methyl-2-oxobutanoate hydroxymethyltransferase [Thiolinea sp.]
MLRRGGFLLLCAAKYIEFRRFLQVILFLYQGDRLYGSRQSKHRCRAPSAPPQPSPRKMKQDKEKIVMLTAYDASFARVADENGVDVILVGDSLGMVIQGHPTTIPVTIDDAVYHTRAVAAATRSSLVLGDLPFMSYTSPEMALRNCSRLMQEGNAQMIKLEGGAPQVETVKQLAFRGCCRYVRTWVCSRSPCTSWAAIGVAGSR